MRKRIKAAGIILLVISILIIVVPYYVVIVASTYTTPTLYKVVTMLPGDGLKTNWEILTTGRNFFLYVFNSFFVAICKVLLTLFICSLAGYALAKFRFRLNKAIFTIIISSMMIPGSLSMVALLTEIRLFHWMNTFYPLIIIGAANAFSTFWYRQSAMDIPNEILESAYVDGSGEFNTFFKIAFPLMRGPTITLSIITFIGSWNDFILPSVVLNTADRYTIPVSISTLSSIYRDEYAPRYLAILVGIAPVLILYLCFARYITRGLIQGAVKG
jgi:multiple sugar transport system permease protein/cellobiose transport system permease protein